MDCLGQQEVWRATRRARACPPLYKAHARDNKPLMPLLHPRSLAAFAVLSALIACACGTSTPEPGRPAPDDSASTPGASASTAAPDNLVVSQDACQVDADCVPAACCHASACTSKEKAKACGDMMCTQVCQPGTIDCGGGCLCHAGRCAAKLMSVVFK